MSSNPPGEETKRKYWAFISYAHADEGWAFWLQKRIERCRIPKDRRSAGPSLGLRGDRIAPVFVDRNELAASPDLDASLREKLEASAHLILIASRASAQRPKVDEEVRYFIELGRTAKIFYFVIDGQPFAAQRGLDPSLECLPPSLLELHAKGVIAQPGWADIREKRYGRWGAFCGIVAGLLAISPDTYLRRAVTRRLRRGLSAAAFALVCLYAGYHVVERQRHAYELQREADRAANEQDNSRREDANRLALREKEEASANALRLQKEVDESDRRAREAAHQRQLLLEKAATTIEETRRAVAGGSLRAALAKLAAQARELQGADLPVSAALKRLMLETLFRTPPFEIRPLLRSAPAFAGGSADPPEFAELFTRSSQQRHSNDGLLVAGLVDHTLQAASPQHAEYTISIMNVRTGEVFSKGFPIDVLQWSISGGANLLVTCHNSNGECVARKIDSSLANIVGTFPTGGNFPQRLEIDDTTGRVFLVGKRSDKRTGGSKHTIQIWDPTRRQPVKEILFDAEDALDIVHLFMLFPTADRMVAATCERIYEWSISTGQLIHTGQIGRGFLGDAKREGHGLVLRMAYDVTLSRLAVSSGTRGTEVISFKRHGDRLEQAAFGAPGSLTDFFASGTPASSTMSALGPSIVSELVFLNDGRDLYVGGSRPRLAALPLRGDGEANEMEFLPGTDFLIMTWRDPLTGLLTGIDRRWNLVTFPRRSALELARKKLALPDVAQIVPFGAGHVAFYGEQRWVLLDRHSLEIKADENLVMGSHHRVGTVWDSATSRAVTGSPYEKSPLIELDSDYRPTRGIAIARPHSHAMFKSASLTDEGRRLAVLWETSYRFERSQGRPGDPQNPYLGGAFIGVYRADDGRQVSGRAFDGSALALFPTKDGGFAVVGQMPGDRIKPDHVVYFSSDGTRTTTVPIGLDADLPPIPTAVGSNVVMADATGRAAYAFNLEKRSLKKLDTEGLKAGAGGFGCSLDVAAASPGGLLVGQMAGRNSMRRSVCLMRSSPEMGTEILAVTPVLAGDRAVFAFLSERELLSYDPISGDLVTWRLPADDEELIGLAERISGVPAPASEPVRARPQQGHKH